MRQDLQGLRCVAVFFVLLYHLWDTTFVVGFLGVDIFFMISGFLMAMILNKRVPLTITAVLDFYFRRIRRIVPLFLFVIFCTLLAGIFLLAPAELINLSMDAFTSSIFMSNFLNVHDSGYFNLYSEFVLFKHTWSLAVELQFYLLVPLLFYAFELLDRYKRALKFVLIGLIAIGSFVLQSIAPPDDGHMQIQNRLWQFMFGFIAFYANSGQIPYPAVFSLKFDDIKNEQKSNLRKRILTALHEVVNFALLSLLILFLCVDLTKLLPLNRLLVTTTASIMLAKTSANALLSLNFIVFLGDISYSIYLVHWSLFTFYRYWFTETYLDRNNHPTFIVGIQLVACTVIVGYFVEKLYKLIGQLIKNWIYLFFVLLISYALVVVSILYVCRVSPPYSYDYHMSLNEQTQSRSDILQLYNTRQNDSIKYDKKEVAAMDIEIHVFSARFYTCQNSTRQIPTHYEANLKRMSWLCHDRGMGTKNIVIIGNSHGRELWHGVTHYFRNVYRTLTLFVRDYCMPFLINYNREDYRPLCEKTNRQLIPVLKQWDEPIDIIILGNEYYNDMDPKIVYPLEKDQYFSAMQTFLNELEEVALDVVFFPRMHMDWNVEPFAQVLQKRLYFQQDLQLFEQTLQQHQQYLPNVQKRIEMLNCVKCIKVPWSTVWCAQDGVCRAVDAKNLTYFRDSKHVAVYGSFLYGELLLNLYERYLVSNNKTVG